MVKAIYPQISDRANIIVLLMKHTVASMDLPSPNKLDIKA
jgi:hypothetical protein